MGEKSEKMGQNGMKIEENAIGAPRRGRAPKHQATKNILAYCCDYYEKGRQVFGEKGAPPGPVRPIQAPLTRCMPNAVCTNNSLKLKKRFSAIICCDEIRHNFSYADALSQIFVDMAYARTVQISWCHCTI